MNGQVVTRIEQIENELRELKTLVQKENKKPSQKLRLMKTLWKKLNFSDDALEKAKKNIFGFEEYALKGK